MGGGGTVAAVSPLMVVVHPPPREDVLDIVGVGTATYVAPE